MYFIHHHSHFILYLIYLITVPFILLLILLIYRNLLITSPSSRYIMLHPNVCTPKYVYTRMYTCCLYYIIMYHLLHHHTTPPRISLITSPSFSSSSYHILIYSHISYIYSTLSLFSLILPNNHIHIYTVIHTNITANIAIITTSINHIHYTLIPYTHYTAHNILYHTHTLHHLVDM